MGKHIHKQFSDEFVKSIFRKYLDNSLSVKQILSILKIKRRRFFYLIKLFKNDPDNFSITYKRKSSPRISKQLEYIIFQELKKDKQLIDNENIPIYNYNYSYIKSEILKKYKLNVSLTTIINRAKKYNFYIAKKKKLKHDREIITNHPGELIQHDSSHHLFAPFAERKWYLITSIDDYSRYLLYANLVEKETSWAHILALESVILNFGIPIRYYVDNHSIFRFIQGRDSIWRKHKKITDQSTPQFKQVLNDLNIDITYALSPQAKGKIERPYRWLQDRLVRSLSKAGIKEIEQAREILQEEVDRYNNYQVHSTTKEIPTVRLKRKIKEGESLFRKFRIPAPYKSSKDIFCIRTKRTVDAYHKISINNQEFRIKGVPLREKVEARITPNEEKGIAEIRFWYLGKLVDEQTMKIKSLNIDQII